MIPAEVEQRLVAALELAGIDTMVAHTYGAIRHLTGGWYSFNYSDFQAGADHQYLSWLIVERTRPDEPVYLCSPLEQSEARLAGHPIAEVARTHAAAGFIKPRAADGLARVLAERRLDRGCVGFELPFLPASMLDALRQNLQQTEIADAHPVLLAVRAVKTRPEIELLRKAAGVVETALESVFARAAEGVSDVELEHESLSAIAARGGVPVQRYILPCIGPGRRRYGAGNPVSQELGPGDVLLVDLGAKVNGMHGDLVRVGAIGTPHFPIEDAVALASAVNSEVATFLRPGIPQRAAFAESMAIAARHADQVAPWGKPLVLHHGLGWSLYEPPFDLSWHGAGIDHESPGEPLDPYGDLEAGMVFSLETAVVSPDGSELYCNIEDPYVLTEHGAHRLNAMSHDVIRCG